MAEEEEEEDGKPQRYNGGRQKKNKVNPRDITVEGRRRIR